MSTANMNIKSSKKFVFFPEEVKDLVKDLEQFTICTDQKKRTSKIKDKIDMIRKNTIENERNQEKISTLEKRYMFWQKE